MTDTKTQNEPLADKTFGDVVAVWSGNDSPVATAPPRTVYSKERTIVQPDIETAKLKLNAKQKGDGRQLLAKLPDDTIPLVFFDPQYRSVLDHHKYGNEGKERGKQRVELPQMSVDTIQAFIYDIEQKLIPSGHLMLWVDKYIMCGQLGSLLDKAPKMRVVDMLTWNKDKMGMGYRSRRYSEHIVVIQKIPVRAKGVWTIHNIPDVWTEKLNGGKNHTHSKPIGLQQRLIEATTNEGDLVVDPAAGGYSVLTACQNSSRNFYGCDIMG